MSFSPVLTNSRRFNSARVQQVLSELQQTDAPCEESSRPHLQKLSDTALQELLEESLQREKAHMIRAMQLACQGTTEVTKNLCDVAILDKNQLMSAAERMELPLLLSVQAQRDVRRAHETIEKMRAIQRQRDRSPAL